MINYLLILLWSAIPILGKLEPLNSKVVPQEINYQGWIGSVSDTDTINVTGTLDMTFRLYNTSTGETSLWDETQNNVYVDKGIFNVLLGSVNPIPESLFTGDHLWLETQVESEVLVPRKKLVSVGYAIKSKFADYATFADTAITHITEVDTVVVVYNADSLNHLHSSQFLRSDKASRAFQTSAPITGRFVSTYDYSGTVAGLRAEAINTTVGTGNARGLVGYSSEGSGKLVEQVGVIGVSHADIYHTDRAIGIYGTATNKGSGSVFGAHFCVGPAGTGPHFGIGITPVCTTGADVTGYGADVWGTKNATIYGIKIYVPDSGTGKHYGGHFHTSNNVADWGKTYGIFSSTNNKGSGDAVGGLFQVGTAGTGPHLGVSGNAYGIDSQCNGVYGYASATGTGKATGGYFKASSSGTGIHYGSYSESDSIGVYGYTTSPNKNYAGYFKGNVYIDNVLQLKPRSGFPYPPISGMIIFNSDSSALFYYNGSQWKKL